MLARRRWEMKCSPERPSLIWRFFTFRSSRQTNKIVRGQSYLSPRFIPSGNEIYTRISCVHAGVHRRAPNSKSAARDRREKFSFYLLFNMIQFTLSTVLYLSINLFKESLFLALRTANSRTLCLILFDLRTRAARSVRQNKEKPRRMRKQIFIT